MKKFFLFLAVFSLLLTGCGILSKPAMDQEADDGKFHYKNKDMGFSIVLPAEFKYYQTQRKEAEGFKDIEFFVPTSDRNFGNEVPGYAKPVVVRIFEKSAWEKAENEKDGKPIYEKKGEKNGVVYTIKFWDDIPTDFIAAWNEEMKKEIINSLNIL